MRGRIVDRCRRSFHPHVHFHSSTRAITMRYQWSHRSKPHSAPALQLNASRYARCRNTRTPVPAKVARTLSHEWIRSPVAIHRARTKQSLLRTNPINRRSNRHGDFIHPDTKRTLRGKPVLHKLIRGISNFNSIDGDTGNGVNRRKDQLAALLGKCISTHFDRPAPQPICMTNPYLLSLAITFINRNKHTGSHQVRVHTPRHFRRKPHANHASRHCCTATRGAFHGPTFGYR